MRVVLRYDRRLTLTERLRRLALGFDGDGLSRHLKFVLANKLTHLAIGGTDGLGVFRVVYAC